ncbi:MAG: DUF1203 domain-containing protein [Pseudomonadota bacterium]
MSFIIQSLSYAPFEPLFDLDATALAAREARRVIADSRPGYPCRVSLRDAEVGETLILVQHLHQPACGPYRASHAIYVREGAVRARPGVGTVPDMLRHRQLSVRAFGRDHAMRAARLADGWGLEEAIDALFADEETDYLHIHNAAPGCYACAVLRA